MNPHKIRLGFAAIIALAGTTALAQSSATLFGTIDIGIAHVKSATSSVTGLSNSGANVSRFGFRGIEDLGGGLGAGYWLEAGVWPDQGTGPFGAPVSFNRRSTVNLFGKWGEVRLGRDDSATFLNALLFDPFLTNGIGGTNAFMMNGAPTQISNAVSYFAPPDLHGFYAQLQHAFGEQVNSSPTAAGEFLGARFGYRAGGLHLAGAVGKLQGVTQAGDVEMRNAGASYDFGSVQPMALWATETRNGIQVRALQLGVKVPVGVGEIRASVARYDTSKSDADWRKFAVGYGHNLSKRTQLYATVAGIDNSAQSKKVVGSFGLPALGNSPGGRSNGYEAGVRHFF